MDNVITELRGFKKGYVRHALISNNLGIVLYSYDDRYELYEFLTDEDDFIIEEESQIATIPNSFDFTEDMFLDCIEQRKFELSNEEEQKNFEAYPTILTSLEEFKEKRPHMVYKKEELGETVDSERIHRCGNCGHSHFQSCTKFEYKGGEEGLETFQVPQLENIVCSCCGRAVENPSLYIGSWGENNEE